MIPGAGELRGAEAILADPDVAAWLRRSARQSRQGCFHMYWRHDFGKTRTAARTARNHSRAFCEAP